MNLQKDIKNYGSLYLACYDRKAFFTSSDQGRYTLWSCQNVCDALCYLLDNIYIRFGTKLYRHIVGIPTGANCAPLVADLFLYCHEIDFMDSLNHDNQADVIEAFNSTSRYLDRFARVCNHVTDFNARYKCLTAKLLPQGYRYHKLRKTLKKL